MTPRPFLTSVYVALLSLAASSALAVGLITQSGAKYTPSSPPSGAEITTISLTSTSGGSNLPFMAAQGFRAGDVPTGSDIVSDTAGVTLRAICKRRWNDSSCKHAVLIGTSTLTAGVAKSVSLKTGTAAGGTALTCADIATDAPGASVQVGAVGTVNLSSLLASPFRTWISTPEMVECHYRSAVGADANLVAWFHVRMWAGGTNWVRAYVENGYVNGGPTTQTHTVTVIIGGATVLNQSVAHIAWSRYDAAGWIGTDPQIRPAHNVQYLIDTKLVPNYWKRSPSATTLNGLDTSYVPMDRGPFPVNTSGTGFGNFIGLLPLWDALYVTTADPRAYDAAIASVRAYNAYSLFRKSSATNRIPRVSDFLTTTYFGGNGGEQINVGGQVWDVAHAPNDGFLPYLITGDYYFYETMAHTAQSWYFCHRSAAGSGTARKWRNDFQNRAIAWGVNIVAGFTAIAPIESEATADLDIVSDYRTWFANVIGDFADQTELVGQNQIGLPYSFSTDNQWTPPTYGGVPQWMTSFWVAANGRTQDLQPFVDATRLNVLAQFMYRWPVGLLGATGAANYHFSRAGIYGVVVDPTAIGTEFGPDETDFYDTWGEVWTATHGSPNAETTNTLQGTSGANPAIASGYWANLLIAISAAVDHAATGAAASWARLTGAANFAAFEAGTGADNCNDIPIFCVVPR